MKINLNQKTLDKIEELNGKVKLTVTGVAIATGLSTLALTGCNSAPVVEQQPTEVVVVDPVEVEPISEEVVEPVSEEVTEPVSEEVVEETYTAEDAISLINDLTVKYPYDTPESIQALVIGANQYTLAEGELQILLDNYGYTIDSLNEGFLDTFYDNNHISLKETCLYYGGSHDEIATEMDWFNRITLEAATLNSNDKLEAKKVDADLNEYAKAKEGDIDLLESGTEYANFANAYSYLVGFGKLTENPYTAIQDVKSR